MKWTNWKKGLSVILSSMILMMLFSMPITVHAAGEVKLYVSPTGSDTNLGTEAAPFKTIEKAKAYVKTINSNMSADIVVYLRGGTYPITSTIEFGTSDSGTNGYNIRYEAYPGEKPIVSGGKQITGFTPFDTTNGKNIYKATGVNFNFRQLYINDNKAIRSREPNPITDKFGTFAFNKFTYVNTADAANVTVGVEKSPTINLANLKNVNKVEINYTTSWSINICRFKSVTETATDVRFVMQDEEGAIAKKKGTQYFSPTKSLYFLENAYEFIDMDNEWYLDQSTNTLYYNAPTGMDMATATVVAPYTETLVKLTGTKEAPVHNIQFIGLAFEHANYTYPSEHGLIEVQTVQYLTMESEWGHPPAAVYATWANHLVFSKNLFKNLGSTGIDLHYGTNNNVIDGNVVCDVAGNGISLGRYGEKMMSYNQHTYFTEQTFIDEAPFNETITNNYVTRVCTEFLGGVGITGGWVTKTKIEHNEVYDLPYTGINVGWGWTDKPNLMDNNSIRYNYVHDNMKILHDGGCIYTLSIQPNSVISDNLLVNAERRDQTTGSPTIYLDEGSKGFTLSNNICFNGATWNKGGTANIFPENTKTNSEITYEAGVSLGYLNINEPYSILQLNQTVGAMSSVPIRPINKPLYTIWVAPAGTTTFAEGPTMTKSAGDATTVKAPQYSGEYRIYLQDQNGDFSPASPNTLTVTGTISLYLNKAGTLTSPNILPNGTIQARTYISNPDSTAKTFKLEVINFDSTGTTQKNKVIETITVPAGANNQLITKEITVSGTNNSLKATLKDENDLVVTTSPLLSDTFTPEIKRPYVTQKCYTPMDKALKVIGTGVALEQSIPINSVAPVTYKITTWYKTSSPEAISVKSAISDSTNWTISMVPINNHEWTESITYITMPITTKPLIYKPIDTGHSFPDYAVYVANASIIALDANGNETGTNLLKTDSFTNPSAWTGGGTRVLFDTNKADVNFFKDKKLTTDTQLFIVGSQTKLTALAGELNPLSGAATWDITPSNGSVSVAKTNHVNSNFQDITLTGATAGTAVLNAKHSIAGNQVGTSAINCSVIAGDYLLTLPSARIVQGKPMLTGPSKKLQIIDGLTGVAPTETLNWTSSDPTIATVGADGTVTVVPEKDGFVTITATSANGVKTGKIDVVVIASTNTNILGTKPSYPTVAQAAKYGPSTPIATEKSSATVPAGLYQVEMWVKHDASNTRAIATTARLGTEWVPMSISLASNTWTKVTYYVELTASGSILVKPFNNITNFTDAPIYLADVRLTRVGYGETNLLENGDFSQPSKPWNGSASTIVPIAAPVPGDVNNSGKLEMSDLLALRNHVMNTAPITDPLALANADVNQDGVVNMSDYLLLRNMLMAAPQ